MNESKDYEEGFKPEAYIWEEAPTKTENKGKPTLEKEDNTTAEELYRFSQLESNIEGLTQDLETIGGEKVLAEKLIRKSEIQSLLLTKVEMIMFGVEAIIAGAGSASVMLGLTFSSIIEKYHAINPAYTSSYTGRAVAIAGATWLAIEASSAIWKLMKSSEIEKKYNLNPT